MDEKVYTPISIEDAVKQIQAEKHKILEAFAKAYLAESGLMPSEVEMVHQQITNQPNIIENVIFFRKKV